MVKLKKWDPADFLEDDRMIAVYLSDILKDNDPVLAAVALGDVIRAKGKMAEIARKAKIGRTGIYKTLSSKGSPGLGTFMNILNAFGFELSVNNKQSRSKN